MEIYLNDNRELKEGILNDIRNTDDICSYIDAAIKELKGVVKKFNPSENFLGVNVPLNKKFNLENNDNYLIGNFYWYSFIDSDVKVIYGFSIDENSSVCNDGLYYYIDDNEYLYDFVYLVSAGMGRSSIHNKRSKKDIFFSIGVCSSFACFRWTRAKCWY